ncbi:hypothetical protein BDQ17DRAFT_1340602 [Cyathus striatus]|nr:hypothetical protein BDQ17DRAFT_1340602 [Cyathus striatus]
MDFVQSLDPTKLVLAGTILSFLLSPFLSPSYNLPIFLFGTYARESTESIQSLQTFTGLLGLSAMFDIIWMTRNDQNGFLLLLTILLLLLKVPTFFAFAAALRQRGSQLGGLGLGGADLAGATVWSMPGGFTSSGREGYQTVDDEDNFRSGRPPSKPQQAQNPHTVAGSPEPYQTV